MNSAAAKVSCHYCGLPVPGRRRENLVDDAEPQYCCFGCRFAEAVAQERGETGEARWTITRLGLAIFFSMTVMVFTLALWSRDLYVVEGSVAPQADALFGLFRAICLVFTLLVVLLLGAPLLENALADLRRLRPTSDVLLLAGVAAAFAYSVASVARGDGHVYFEVVCMVLVAVTLGRWLEATGRLKTTEALRGLEKLLPDRARVIRGEVELELSPKQIALGDHVRVLPGERIAADGRLLRGCAAVDEQVLTGESRPAVKEPGDAVLGGTLNLDGDIVIAATAPGTDGTLKTMAEAVLAAAAQKERYQRLADRIAAWFLPAVLAVALAALAVHWRWHGLDHGLLAALAVVLIACPCALALATPMAFWAALGRASRGHVLIHSGDAFARLCEARAIAFDKTGTLTTGRPEVEWFACDDRAQRDLALRVAAAIAGSSRHELSGTIVQFVGHDNLPATHGARSFAGRGVCGRVDAIDGHAFLGSPRFMQEAEQQLPPELERALRQADEGALSRCCIAWGGRVRGVFAFRETLRDEAPAMLAWCRQAGYHVAVLTGDHRDRAAALARDLGDVQVEAELLPQDKLRAIDRLKRESGPVVMVGDGVNDAPALAAAHVGISLGSGADVSRHAGDICLLASDLTRLPWTIALARRTVAVVRWNLLWAFLYNTLGVALAAAGLLNPIVAAIAMVVSSLLVISNSLRLARIGDDELLALASADGIGPAGCLTNTADDSASHAHLTGKPPAPQAAPQGDGA
jgi:heavy metal translocating P-type ATPase